MKSEVFSTRNPPHFRNQNMGSGNLPVVLLNLLMVVDVQEKERGGRCVVVGDGGAIGAFYV
ncbi:hypothetical protein HanPSC8_Chr16g0735531 [Helianthus annuus]|nr:hypothetical protein HanIR_Chr16g0832871 [Helianthus annuus]KAJ0822731.1 hypothetical protein HanPSC8_Chr16g0735531 [Helianthus annuus]